MSALVPYVGRLAMAGARSRAMVRYTPRVAWAARTIGRFARRYVTRRVSSYMRKRRGGYLAHPNKRMFRRSNIGDPVSSTNAKSTLIDNTQSIVRSTRILYFLDITQLAQNALEINTRQRQHVNMRGFKICMEVTNTTPNALYFNVAVIAPKDDGATFSGNDFFRQNTQFRSQNFSNALSGMEFHCLPINTDDYTVLRHKRYQLNHQNSTNAFANRQYGTSYRTIDWYVPLKRQVRYRGGETTEATSGKVLHVFWFALFNSAAGAGSTQCGITSQRIITYFREPRH